MSARAELHELVEQIPDREIEAARRYLEGLRGGNGAGGSLTWLLDHAPIDDEPTTPEEEEGLIEAREQARRGDLISADEIKRRLLA